MKIIFEVSGKKIELTDEHSSSSYGIPVAVCDGIAYGKNEAIKFNDELDFLFEPAARTILVASLRTDLNDEEKRFIEKFAN
jgi:hypothetical protein